MNYYRIITKEEAKKLFQLEEDSLAPDETFTNEDFNQFVNKITGMFIIEYCLWRYPENPEKQYKLTMKILQ